MLNGVSGLTENCITPTSEEIYETIETNSIEENEALMANLQTELLKNQFDLFEKDSGTSWSENDCDQNRFYFSRKSSKGNGRAKTFTRN